MKILFDHQVFAWQRFGGISRYFAELIRGLRARGEQAVLPSHFYTQNIHLQELVGETLRPIAQPEFPGKKLLQNFLGRRYSLRALRELRPDVLHPTYFDPYFLPTAERLGIPFVLTVHDMIHEKFGHGSGGRFSIDATVVPGKKLLAERAAAIVAVSEHTKRDLLEIYPQLPPDKITVIWHGNSLKINPKAPLQLNLPEQFVLFVGNRGGYKNFSFFIREMAELLRERTGLFAVLAGSSPFSETEKGQLNALKISDKCLHQPFRDDAELGEIYRRAACFVFPSRYEGFGIPVLESFAAGCPAVLHESSSLPEVGGAAALYFRENEPGSLKFAVQNLLDAPEKQAALREAGFSQLQKFTWEKSVAAHLELYKKVANN
ncbi:MAG: glycosyltransferase family 4 protein [Saprospiraceae bacterium]